MGLFGAGDPPCPKGSICSGQAKTNVGRTYRTVKKPARGGRPSTEVKQAVNTGTPIYHASATKLNPDGTSTTDVYIIKDNKWQKAATTNDGGKTYTYDDNVAGAGLKKELSNPNGAIHKNVDAGVNKAADKAGVPKKDKDTLLDTNPNTASTDENEGESQPSGEPSKPAPGANEGIKGGTYPVDIGSTKQDIIKFDMLEYRPSEFKDNRPAVDTAKIIETVILAVPGGIQDQSNANWTAESMDPMQKAAAKAAFNVIGRGNEGVNQAIADAKSAFENGGGEMKQIVQGIFAGKAAGVGNQVFQRGQGQIMNPNMELLFNGPSVRQFSFNFLLAPRSKTEQDQVVNIIRFFKQGMSPTKSEANMFLKSPNTFRLRYIHRKSGEDSEHKFLTKFKECALTSTGVNYTPNTNYATFPDGGMVAYQLALTFQELEPIFNNDYAKVEEGSIGY